MIKIAVTGLEYDKAVDVFDAAPGIQCLRAPATEIDLARFIKDNGISHVIVGVEKYHEALYEALPEGGVIARFGVGHDGINKKLASAKGLWCTNTPGALDTAVAECAIGLILTAARRLTECITDNKNGVWKNRIGTELSSKTLAVIGCGRIGSKVAAIAKNGFGMQTIGFDIRLSEKLQCFDVLTTDFVSAVKDADFVTLHIPDIPETEDFINYERISMMRSTAILINTARGGVLDENALYDAIKNGVIAGAALDVFKHEPYIPASLARDLRNLDTVIMTPHIGSSSCEACANMARSALQSIDDLRNKRFDTPGLLNP